MENLGRSGPRSRGRLGWALGVLCLSRAAHADLCVTQAVSLPGLPGAPDWRAPGTVLLEEADPRWLAAPRQGFESEATGKAGFFRVLVDAAHGELSVAFIAPSDPNVGSAADVIYFGFTTDGTAASLAKS